MQIINRLEPLRTAIARLRAHGSTIALVPTMGALHEGHLTLVDEARAKADRVVVSIFVNPKQFGEDEDLDAYPRQMERDGELLEARKVDLLWAPPVAEVYPAGFATTVSVAGLTDVLCGADRPGHFDGVATVVTKLFNETQPDAAFFGEKDWQQLAVIRRMARDLDVLFPAADAIHGVPIVREDDGLAMSSRNAYLSPAQRQQAAALPAAMRDAIALLGKGEDTDRVLGNLQATLKASGFNTVDYAELRDETSLASVDTAQDGARLFVAARIGGTRLIDNMGL